MAACRLCELARRSLSDWLDRLAEVQQSSVVRLSGTHTAAGLERSQAGYRSKLVLAVEVDRLGPVVVAGLAVGKGFVSLGKLWAVRHSTLADTMWPPQREPYRTGMQPAGKESDTPAC